MSLSNFPNYADAAYVLDIATSQKIMKMAARAKDDFGITLNYNKAVSYQGKLLYNGRTIFDFEKLNNPELGNLVIAAAINHWLVQRAETHFYMLSNCMYFRYFFRSLGFKYSTPSHIHKIGIGEPAEYTRFALTLK